MFDLLYLNASNPNGNHNVYGFMCLGITLWLEVHYEYNLNKSNKNKNNNHYNIMNKVHINNKILRIYEI